MLGDLVKHGQLNKMDTVEENPTTNVRAIERPHEVTKGTVNRVTLERLILSVHQILFADPIVCLYYS